MASTPASPSTPVLRHGKFSSYLPALVTCMVLCGIPGSMLMSCGSIFYTQIADSLHVQTAQVTLYMSCMFIAAAATAPLVGRIIGKADLRVILSAAVVLEAVCFILFSQAQEVWQFWIIGAFLGLCNTCLINLSTPTIVNRWFKDKVGLLVGLCMAFTGVGGVIFIMIGQAVIDAAGWRTAWVVYAVIIPVCCLPLTLFVIRNDPRDRGLLPYQDGSAAKNGPVTVAAATSVAPDVAMKSPAFWLICIFCGLINMTIPIASFFPKYVTSLQADPAAVVLVTGAVLASIAMAGQAIGKIGLGFLSDMSVKKAIALACSTGAVGVLCCWLGAHTALLPIGGFVFGFFYAAALVLSPLICRAIFGSGKNYPVIYSRVFVSMAIFSALGQIVWPWLADNCGGFDTVFTVALGSIALIAVLGLVADSYEDKLPRESDEA